MPKIQKRVGTILTQQIMKKFLLLITVAAFSIACGSNSGPASVEDQAKEKCEAIIKAMEAGDFEKADNLKREFAEWGQSLNEADFEKADKVVENEKYEEKIDAAHAKGVEKYATDAYENIIKAFQNDDPIKAKELMEELEMFYENLCKYSDRALVDAIGERYVYQITEYFELNFGGYDEDEIYEYYNEEYDEDWDDEDDWIDEDEWDEEEWD